MTLPRAEKVRRLAAAVRQFETETDLESMARQPAPGLESADLAPRDRDAAPEAAVRKVLAGREDDLTEAEVRGLEAVILPRGRPAAFIRDGVYDAVENPWGHLNAAAARARVEPAFAAIGRVELPNTPQLPYGGTGFLVGPGLLMTNRHVASLFAAGTGIRRLVYRAGDAAVHFRRHKDDPDDDRATLTEVEAVVMIHPYWDMALLRLGGLAAVRPLVLSVEPPRSLVDREVAAVGYPARDDRNDLAVQDRIFQRVYGVKRFQPGKARVTRQIRSFGTVVTALTHDSSTLGGNSGSALLDVRTGQVVGLHFAGVYLDANFAVPAYELARDPRVVDAGVAFAGRVPPTGDYDDAWARADEGEHDPRRPGPSGNGLATENPGTATWTIPLRVTVAVGSASFAQPDVTVTAATTGAASPTEALRVPVIHPNLDTRDGYRPGFLDLDGDEVPLPKLTNSGKQAAARLEDNTHELKYHHFSVVMHKGRRLALFTAANVDWRDASRLVNGRRPTRDQLGGLRDNDSEKWVTDPRIPDGHQLPDVFFTKDRRTFDKGHLVRRDDVCWGESFDDMQKANGDTFHTTNCSPQIAAFNQARNTDNWGDLENLVQRQTRAEKVCVFAGPVFDDGDPVFHGRDERGDTAVQIPRAFWKVVVARTDAGPAAFGFLLEQDLSDVALEFAVPPPWRRHLRRIADIEAALGGLAKLTWLKDHDAFESAEGRALADAVRR